ncbi:MAG: hypothetical protein ABW033_02330 [Acidimicrobiia bacterium]
MNPREPHPLSTHVAVDTAVAFLGILVVGLILGLSFLVIVAIAIIVGVCLAPYTRRTEVRQLAARDDADEVDGADPGHE